MVDIMFDALLRHLDELAHGEEHPQFSDALVRQAVITLFCRVIVADKHVLPVEVKRLETLVDQTFGAGVVDWKPILDSMTDGETQNEPIIATTQVILASVAENDRQTLVRMMIDIAASDGLIKPEEKQFINRVAELLKTEADYSGYRFLQQ